MILNFIFIPIFGYMAAAYTTLFGFILLLLLHYIMSKKLGLTDMYDNRFVFLMTAVMVVGGIALGGLYLLPAYVRWIVIVVIGVVALFMGFRFYKKIKGK